MMISSIAITMFLIFVILLYLISIAIPMIMIRKRGFDSHGSHEGASLLTRLTPIASFGWLLYIVLYVFDDAVLRGFLLLSVLDFEFIIIMGMIVVGIGFVFEVLGICALGSNFRIELPIEETTLVTEGIYKYSRNPIVVGVFFLVIGSFLMIPTILSLVLLILNVLTFDSKVRDEEKFLIDRFGKEYAKYKKTVGIYLPFLGK